MTVSAFRKDQSLQNEWAKELRENKLLALVLNAIESDHPANFAVNSDAQEDVSPTRAAIELGVTRGYSMVLGRIRLCGLELREAEGPPESEYGPLEEEDAST
jgi:hypothetical protein